MERWNSKNSSTRVGTGVAGAEVLGAFVCPGARDGTGDGATVRGVDVTGEADAFVGAGGVNNQVDDNFAALQVSL